jgi:manganese/zinc/iron transport system permease protein
MNETVLVMVAVSAACAVPGVFLVLRRMVLVGDAMSHVLLLGIVLGYFLARDPASPILFFGAAASGVLTVALVEALQRTKRLKEDAAIGLVFPALFSLGTLLASLYLRNTHLDVDRVLLGSAELAYLDRVALFGVDLGPRGMIIPGIVFAVSLALVFAFQKELKLATFDPGLAAMLGFAPAAIHYGLMVGVSLATVAAFDAVGPVLVLAFFAVPPATARLLTNRFEWMLAGSVVIAVLAAVAGTWLAIAADITIAGTVCAVLGGLFGLAYLVAPQRGLVAAWIHRRNLIRKLDQTILIVHLLRHEGTPAEPEESRRVGLHRHLNWSEERTNRVARRAGSEGWIVESGESWKLTDAGRERARATAR